MAILIFLAKYEIYQKNTILQELPNINFTDEDQYKQSFFDNLIKLDKENVTTTRLSLTG